MISKTDLIDAPERRSVLGDTFEIRAAGTTLKLEGYASVFDKGYEVYGGPPNGWTEFVNRGAFDRTLSEGPDLHLLINHEGLPLARTKSGTLQLSTDKTGLLVRADLDRRDPDVAGLEIKMGRGDLDEMSFAFRVKRQTWSDDETVRSLDEVSIHKGDVSIVNFGANPNTSVTLRRAVELLANGQWGDAELAELRAMSSEVDRAMAALRIARVDDALRVVEMAPIVQKPDRPKRSNTLTISDAMKMCRPDGAPEPFSVASAKEIA
jgi:Escherichia/Staphylococcus phage prohead protease